jgi:hypothetical protein
MRGYVGLQITVPGGSTEAGRPPKLKSRSPVDLPLSLFESARLQLQTDS